MPADGPTAAPRPDAALPLRIGDSGPGVADLQRRLSLSGYQIAGEFTDSAEFTRTTADALCRFQQERGLVVDGICGPQSWAALVEADHRLGSRLLYYRSPMMRGDDVADLQQQIGRLGFDPKWVDGIFGPATDRAVRDFQLNVGLAADGLTGRYTIAALARLRAKAGGPRTVTEVREAELRWRWGARIENRRLVIGDTGELPTVAHATARQLRKFGAVVLSLSTPDLSEQARLANVWGGDAYLGLTLAQEDLQIAYFSTAGFESAEGRNLATRCSKALGTLLPGSVPVNGRRFSILRETRMPTAWCRIGPASMVVHKGPAIARAFAGAIFAWFTEPPDQLDRLEIGDS